MLQKYLQELRILTKKRQHTTIAIQRETRERLLEFGLMHDTYDQVINRLMDECA